MFRRLYDSFVAWFAARRWGSWLTRVIYQPLDRAFYKVTKGRRGLGPARSVLLLTTTGRRTGQPRANPLMYLEHEGAFWVMGSNFGGASHPAWTANLLANPEGTVQIGPRTIPVRARRASEEERQRLWPELVRVYPPWDAYTEWTDRSFRLFELRPR
jgi:deazaflavin-dependent oxidoreductase (nitroreductase family)